MIFNIHIGEIQIACAIIGKFQIRIRSHHESNESLYDVNVHTRIAIHYWVYNWYQKEDCHITYMHVLGPGAQTQTAWIKIDSCSTLYQIWHFAPHSITRHAHHGFCC